MRSAVTPLVLTFAAVACLAAGSALGQPEHLHFRADVDKLRLAGACLDKATRYFAEHEYQGAEKKLAECLETLPDYSEAHFLMARVHYAQKRFEPALESMETAEATYETSAMLVEQLRTQVDAERRSSRERLQAAVADLRVELARTTNPQEQSRIEGQIDQYSNNIAELDRQLLEVFQRRDTMPADYCFIHGNILLRLQRYNEAAAQYLQALRIEPTHGEATNNLASLLLQARQPAKALEIIQQAEERGVPVNPELKQAVIDALQP